MDPGPILIRLGENQAALLADHRLHQGQAQTIFATLLDRIEKPLGILFDTRVTKGHGEMLFSRPYFDCRRVNMNHATVRGSRASVHREGHDGLFQLGNVGQHAAEPRLGMNDDLDPVLRERFDERGKAAEHSV